MAYFSFNIGKPYTNDWWNRNVQQGMITAGYDGEPGDRGDIIMNQLNQSDILIAYANRHGYIGAGVVGPSNTYRIISDDEASEWESPHRHIRQVTWIHTIENLKHAITVSEAHRSAPRQAKEWLAPAIGKEILQLLALRSAAYRQYIEPENKLKFSEEINKSLRDTHENRLNRLSTAPKKAPKILKFSYEFCRNPDVVAETLHIAGGICQHCKKTAPFRRKNDGSLYLEVHHKKPLAQGGDDTLDNTVALCPNCHRMMHHGQPSADLQI